MFIIGMTVAADGNIKTDQDVSVQGVFNGRIEAASIRINATAHVTGTLVAPKIIIDGFVTADIYADHLTLSDACTVRGRIFHADLVMAQHAYFEGQSRRYADPRFLFTTHANEGRFLAVSVG